MTEEILTKDQQQLYSQIKEMFHDENLNSTNLAKMIPLLFPRGITVEEEDVLTEFLNDSMIPVLEAKAELGVRIMDIFYQFEED